MVSLMLLSKSCSRSTVLFDPPPERLCARRKESFVLISSIDRSHTLGVLFGHDDYLYLWAHYYLGKKYCIQMSRPGAMFYWDGLSIIVVKTINNWGQGFIVGIIKIWGQGYLQHQHINQICSA